ncbi:alpha/beta hydrolase [Halorarius halobius]|uniref:alpha/beta hydrolase n=1 Tax=Halorarius halobius TaxID=2962671 RepID=UPI0020CE0B1F|nr:alpha/beta hydrolase [Halorarius halobius]
MHERESVTFESRGTECAAWRYRPEAADPPVVVMAHGFGGTRRMGLPRFAARLADAGVGVLLFDYRGFGDSGGTPRNLVSPRKHLADWDAAVDYARSLDGVGDGLGVAGWSFSGGHALVTAARRDDVDAYAGIVPFSDGPRTLLSVVRQQGLDFGLRATGAALRDLGRAATLRSPHYVPLVGQPGEVAPLATEGSEAGYRAIVPDDLDEAEWNRCAARILLTVGLYRPVSYAREVDCPALVVEATDDQLIPAGTVARLVDRLDDVERVRVEGDHFAPYLDPLFDTVADRQVAFFERQLR